MEPSANAPWRIVSGTALRASLDATITTGRINNVHVKPPESTDLPNPAKRTKTANPSKP